MALQPAELLAVLQVPYTEEELALSKPSPAKLVAQNPKAGKKSVKELPEGAGPLMSRITILPSGSPGLKPAPLDPPALNPS